MSRGTVRFIGLSGFEYPHTRVRCYRFAEVLAAHGYRTQVFSLHDRLAPRVPEAAMYGLSDPHRLWLILVAALRLLLRPQALLYVQKIHYHALAALLVHRLTGAPYVLDYDDWEVGTDPYGVPLFCGFKDPRLTRSLFGSENPERILCRVAQRAIFAVGASRFLVERLSEFTDRVVYVPTGVDAARFQPRATPHPGVVILWNGVVWGKMIRDNVLLLLRALPAVILARPDVRVRIIGGGAYMEEVHRSAESMGLLDHVDFPGWIPPDAMPGELARADIGVLPCAHDDSWHKGKSPTKLFEYMAAGLAVVVMGGEAAHIVEHGTSGFVAGDDATLAEHLIALAVDEKMRESVGRAARSRIEERYSLDVLGEVLAEGLRRWWR
ncbi:glycosyltransferase family 4 protein [Candidatus Fermentibacteria bacterium]|nr:glycosyltransferase family 4 protein [Candidatus Fermentibacteria bacterium]